MGSILIKKETAGTLGKVGAGYCSASLGSDLRPTLDQEGKPRGVSIPQSGISSHLLSDIEMGHFRMTDLGEGNMEVSENLSAGHATKPSEPLRDLMIAHAMRAHQQRMQAGKTEGLRRGLYLYKTPFGYKKVQGRLAIVPRHCALVREIFARAAHGESFASIARYCNATGQLRLHKGKWSAAFVGRLIDNPIYCGFIRWNRTKISRADGTGFPTIRRLGRHEWRLTAVSEAAIVEKSLWLAANKNRP